MGKKSSNLYRTIVTDPFPPRVEIAFVDDDSRQTMIYEKVRWEIEGEEQGLRYGENPDQPAALYRLTNGNLTLGEVSSIAPGHYLASDIELLQSGKHPGKINITDADAALNILRYFDEKPCAVIVKHNNPCGVALGASLSGAYERALMADRIAAFGGAVALNREVDLETAEMIAASYTEVVLAPEYAEGSIAVLAGRKNLRIMRINNMKRLKEWIGQPVVDSKSLIDGGLILQWSFKPKLLESGDLEPAACTNKGESYRIEREPREEELEDIRFGWLVESGVTSNSVIYVKDGATVGIGTGEQDRVGVAEIARNKAYRNSWDRLAWERHKISWYELKDDAKKREIVDTVAKTHAGLEGSVMVSDAFFPKRDGVDVGLEEGVKVVVQPGGSLRDFEAIEACNEYGATMIFTGQRSFRH